MLRTGFKSLSLYRDVLYRSVATNSIVATSNVVVSTNNHHFTINNGVLLVSSTPSLLMHSGISDIQLNDYQQQRYYSKKGKGDGDSPPLKMPKKRSENKAFSPQRKKKSTATTSKQVKEDTKTQKQKEKELPKQQQKQNVKEEEKEHQEKENEKNVMKEAEKIITQGTIVNSSVSSSKPMAKEDTSGILELNIFPTFEKLVYPGTAAYVPITESEYAALKEKTVAMVLVKPEIREQYSKDKSQFKLTSLDQINKYGVTAKITKDSTGKFKAFGYYRIELVPTEEVEQVKKAQEESNEKIVNIGSETIKKIESIGADSEKIPPPQSSTTTFTSSSTFTDEKNPLLIKKADFKIIYDPPIPPEQKTKLRALILQLAKKVQQSSQYVDSSFYNAYHNTNTKLFDDPGAVADFLASICPDTTPKEYQNIIEASDIIKRLELVLALIQSQFQIIEFNKHVGSQYEEKISKQQRKSFLLEFMKTIKKEMGMDQDEKETLKKKFLERWSKLVITDEQIKQVFNDEIEKFSGLEPASSEYNVTRNYLDWITLLPWNNFTNDNFDIPSIKEILDKDHYGLEDIKEMIQTFIAVGKLRGSVGGKIMLLVGPPGTGKTSIGKSIATALGRQFYRFSVGGISDVAEIKGHRRTFVGAMPGKIIQALKMVKTANPVILIDEIDKISKGNQGDPNAALLEVLDPQQNKNFLDHYLDIPFDLSKVLFICTANLTHTIPAPLLDRMDVMRLNGYIQSEQIQIAKNYLIPLTKNEIGINDEQLVITDEAIKHLCEYWCRESGVRNLKKMIDRIFRKVAFKMASNPDVKEQIIVSPDNLEEYAGMPKYRVKKYYQTPTPGIALGLGWSENGGVPLYLESVVDRYHSGPGLKTTGSLGEVMKESTDIAYTYVKIFLETIDENNNYFGVNSIHVHAPEGATPKDGPSAGITLITSLLSLALNKPIQPGVAMTGEITLTGKVLAVGGITEKMIAAKREGVKKVIIPKDNKKELEEIPDYVKEGFTIYLADYYKDVYDVAFHENPTLQPIILKLKNPTNNNNNNK